MAKLISFALLTSPPLNSSSEEQQVLVTDSNFVKTGNNGFKI